MSAPPAAEYLTSKGIRIHLEIKTKEFDGWVKQKKEEGNQDLQIWLMQVADVLPLVANTEFFIQATTNGLIFVEAQWKRKLELVTEAESLEKKYKQKMELLIKAIKSQPSVSKRAKAATASCSYSSDLLASLPTITDKDQNLL